MPWVQQMFGPSVSAGQAMFVLFCCYLLGGFSTGYYLVRLRLGRDVRDMGSGSTGARNVGRLLGTGGFVATLAGDCLKGLLAVWGARYTADDERFAGWAMFAVVLGHVWPVQLGFRGGKGAATALGALLAFDFTLTVRMLLLLAGVYWLLRKTTVSGLAAFALLPLGGLLLGRGAPELVALTALAVLVLAAHRSNLAEEAAQLAEGAPSGAQPDKPIK